MTSPEENMYERFTDRARKALSLANQEAQRFNHDYIGTEHLLLGIVKEGGGVGSCVLKNFDVTLRKVRLETEKLVPSGTDMVTMGKLHQTPLAKTPLAKKVIEVSIEEARKLGHNYVGTEHLLLALISPDIKVGEVIAVRILKNLGIDIASLREEAMILVGHSLDTEDTEIADWTDKSVKDQILFNVIKDKDGTIITPAKTEKETPSDPLDAEKTEFEQALIVTDAALCRLLTATIDPDLWMEDIPAARLAVNKCLDLIEAFRNFAAPYTVFE